jgi:inosine/xanthosine triphosphatase
MIKGAKKRAQVALTQVEAADYGVGLEGGLHKIDIDWFGRSWIAIVDASGKLGLASSVSCYIPPPMMKLIDEGKTMSEVCEILYGRKDIGKQEGYFGLLTNNHITRAKGYSEAVVMALSTFMSAEPK